MARPRAGHPGPVLAVMWSVPWCEPCAVGQGADGLAESTGESEFAGGQGVIHGDAQACSARHSFLKSA